MKKNSLVEQLSRIHSLMGTKKVLSEGKWFNLASEFLSDLISKAQRVGDEVIVNGVKISKKTWDDLVTAIDNPALFDALSDAEKRLLAKAAQSDTKVVDEIYKSFLTTLINKAKSDGRELSEESIIKLVNRDLDANPGKTTYESMLELTVDEAGKTDPFVAQLLSKKISKKIMEVESNTFTPEIAISKAVDDVITPSPSVTSGLFSLANKIAMNLPDKIEGFLTGPNVNTVRNLLNDIRRGVKKTLTEDEFKLIVDNVSRKDLADAFTQEFGPQIELDRLTNELLAKVENGNPYDEYLDTLDELRNKIFGVVPPLKGSNEWIERFLGEIEYKFANDFKTKLGQQNNKILKDFVQEETEYISKNLTKETLLDIAYWDGRLFEISDAERDFILKNSDKNLIAKVKSNFVNRTADFDRILKLIKTFTNTTDTAAKIRITAKLKTELEQLTAKNINDIQLIMNYLEQLKNSKFITKEEKDALENLLNTLQTNSGIIKKWGSTTAIYEEKSTVSKWLSMLETAFFDSFDSLNTFSFGKFDPGFRKVKGKKGFFGYDFSWNMSKKLEEKYGMDVLQSQQLFANTFRTGSARGLPKLENQGAQEIFDKFGNINYLRGIYVLTLTSKILKGSWITGLILSLIEGLTFIVDEIAKGGRPRQCHDDLKKLVAEAREKGIDEIYMDETNMPESCNRTSIFYAVAWDYATTEGIKYKVDNKMYDEIGEKFDEEMKKPLWTWLLHTFGWAEIGYDIVRIVDYFNTMTSDSKIDEVKTFATKYVKDNLEKPIKDAEDELIKTGEEWKSKGDSLMTKTKQEADTLKSEIKNVLDSTTYFNQAERDSIVAAVQNAKDKITDAVTTLTPESFKQEYSCYWDNGFVNTNQGKTGVDVINNESVIIYFSGKNDYKGTWKLSKKGDDWYYVAKDGSTNNIFGKCK